MCAVVQAQAGFRWDFNEMIYLLNTTRFHIWLHDDLPSFRWLPVVFFACFLFDSIRSNRSYREHLKFKKKNTQASNNSIPTSHFHRAIQLFYLTNIHFTSNRIWVILYRVGATKKQNTNFKLELLLWRTIPVCEVFYICCMENDEENRKSSKITQK